MFQPLYSALSPAGRRARLSVLIFHRVLARPDPLIPDQPDIEQFDRICRWLASWFTVLPLEQAVARLQERSLPARALSITFDDGYRDNAELAMPILQRHGLTATFFVTTGFLNGGRMWNDTVIEAVRRWRSDRIDGEALGLGALPCRTDGDRLESINRILDRIKHLSQGERQRFVDALEAACGEGLPSDLMMTDAQVQALVRGGMTIGGHTLTHPILAVLDDASAQREISECKTALESITDRTVSLFAYPNGRPVSDFLPRHAEMAERAGFSAALTTAWGAAGAETDRYNLPRFTPWDRGRAGFGARLALNLARSRRAGAVAATAAA